MSTSTVTLSPTTGKRADLVGLGAVAESGLTSLDHAYLTRVGRPDYGAWLSHIAPAAGCSHPVRLRLEAEWSSPTGGRPEAYRVSDDLPDGLFYVACKNRRASVCPACAETYRADTFQLVKAGLVGGKGVPDTVTEHPCFFVTLTAPTFGPVHSRVVGGNGRVRPCRMRRTIEVCRHGRMLVCHRRHDTDSPSLGEPLCRDCYDYDHQAVWNLHAPELWRRTTIALNRTLRTAAKDRGIHVRLSFAKVAEYQRRGVVHFHALIRLDGYNPTDPDSIIRPDPSLTPEHLASYITDAATGTTFTTEPHPHHRDGWPIAWGAQVDIRPVRLNAGDCDNAGALTTTAVAAYLAKYATKATEEAGLSSRRLTDLDIQLIETDTHQNRQLLACWSLGRRPFYYTSTKQREAWTDGWGKLHKWAHMLGFGGHFSTKSRRYSTTLGALRAVRRAFQRGEPIGPPADEQPQDHDQDGDDAAVTLTWIFDGTGWLTTADAALANTSAAKARERRPNRPRRNRNGHGELREEDTTHDPAVGRTRRIPVPRCAGQDALPVEMARRRPTGRQSRPSSPLRPRRRARLVPHHCRLSWRHSTKGDTTMGHIQDRWYRPKMDPETGEPVLNARGNPVQERTELHGIGMRYKARYFDPDRNERSKSFPDRQKKRAEDFLIEVESDKREGKYIDPRAGQVTFGDIAKRWLDSQTADYTSRERFATRVNVHMVPYFGKKAIGSIKPSDVQTWLRGLQDREASETSRALYFGHLVSIFNFAIEDKKIGSNPALARSVKRPRMNNRQVVPWSRERAKAVRTHLPDRYKLAIDLPAGIGIRKGELFAFSLDDIDRNRQLVKVQRQVRLVQGRPVFALPKGGKTREVPIGSALLHQLDRYAERFQPVPVTLPWAHLGGKPTTANLLMVDPTGCALVPKIMDKSWLGGLKAAGVHPHTRADGIHALRHLYASVLLDAGESIKALSKYLGHTDPGFTLRVYTHLMPSSHERTRRAVDDFLTTGLGVELPSFPEAA